jgi:cytochrome oxidase Cu insertion factor (SCO1/SenC/PrrC family)
MSGFKRAGRAWVWLGLIAATVLALHPAPADAADGPALPQGMQAPAEPITIPVFELPTPDGNVVRAADLQGKVVVVRFWATW